MFFDGKNGVIGLIFLLMLTGCSSSGKNPPFSASGYLADRGVVRLWRKNAPGGNIAIRTLYTPFNQPVTEQTDYQWYQGNLLSVHRHLSGSLPDDVTLRFDEQGKVSFMQRQLATHRESVSQQAVDLYRFDASRMLNISNALQAGRIRLQQGIWQQGNTVLTCDSLRVQTGLDSGSLAMITRSGGGNHHPVYIAWLQGPEGTQLLKATTDNLCHGQPTEKDL